MDPRRLGMVAIVLVGCGADAAAPPAPAPAPRVVERGASTDSYTVTELGDPGDRAVLRYAPRPGRRHEMTIVLEAMTFSRWHPSVTLRGAREVTRIDDGGALHLRETIERIEVGRTGWDAQIVDELQWRHDAAAGTVVEATIDARGRRIAKRIVLPSGDVDPQIVERIDRELGELDWLPAEAVGSGARWRSTSTLRDAERVFARTTAWQLVARHGDAIVIRGTTSDSGGAQPPRDGVEVLSTSAHGTFETAVDLAMLDARATARLTGEYELREGGRRHTVGGATERSVAYRPVRPVPIR